MQDSFDGERDTFLRKAWPNTNASGSGFLDALGDPSNTGAEQVALVHWDLSGVTLAGQTELCSAELDFTLVSATVDSYSIYAAKRAWDFSQATWNNATSTVAWEIAGAQGATDRGSLVGYVYPTGSGAKTVSASIAPYIVANWIDHPEQNYGLIIASHSSSDNLVVYSDRASSPTNRPMLRLVVH